MIASGSLPDLRSRGIFKQKFCYDGNMDKNQPSEPEDYSHFGYYGSYARWLSVCAYSPED